MWANLLLSLGEVLDVGVLVQVSSKWLKGQPLEETALLGSFPAASPKQAVWVALRLRNPK